MGLTLGEVECRAEGTWYCPCWHGGADMADVPHDEPSPYKHPLGRPPPAYPALFHCNFILAWLLISFPTQPYFIAISFLPGLWFHCLPSLISLRFFSCLAIYFIAYPALFHCNFIPAWPFLPSIISLQFHSCLAFPTQHYFIAISFLPGLSYPALFHCNFIPAWLVLPSIISLQFHSCLAFNFISCPALFHYNFIPAWLLISLPT